MTAFDDLAQAWRHLTDTITNAATNDPTRASGCAKWMADHLAAWRPDGTADRATWRSLDDPYEPDPGRADRNRRGAALCREILEERCA